MSKVAFDTSLLRLPSFRTNVGKLVWFCLLRDSDETGMVNTSACSIAREIGVCEKTVRNTLSELCADGVIAGDSPNTTPNNTPNKVRYKGRQIAINLSISYKQNLTKQLKQKSEMKS